MSEPKGQERVVPDEARARALLEQLKSVHAVDVGRDMVIAAVNFSYPKLGLSDETREVRDLDDVRLSIELIRAILDVLDRERGGAVTSDLHDTLAQMQLAYAHAVQLANAERAAAHEAAGDAAPAAQGEPAPEEPPAKKRPAAKKKPGAPAKPTAKRKPAAKKKPAARKKPAGGG